jgi:hypothetical protein
MRITKKFAGASCIGKQVFQPSESLQGERSDEIQELDVLETLFYHRVGDRSIGGMHRHLLLLLIILQYLPSTCER